MPAKADAIIRRAPDELSALIHPAFVYVNAGGIKFGKPGHIETYCRSSRIIFEQQRVSDLEVRQFGGFAVATMVLRDELSVDGRAIAATYRSLCVFAETQGRWLWAAGQTMRAE